MQVNILCSFVLYLSNYINFEIKIPDSIIFRLDEKVILIEREQLFCDSSKLQDYLKIRLGNEKFNLVSLNSSKKVIFTKDLRKNVMIDDDKILNFYDTNLLTQENVTGRFVDVALLSLKNDRQFRLIGGRSSPSSENSCLSGFKSNFKKRFYEITQDDDESVVYKKLYTAFKFNKVLIFPWQEIPSINLKMLFLNSDEKLIFISKGLCDISTVLVNSIMVGYGNEFCSVQTISIRNSKSFCPGSDFDASVVIAGAIGALSFSNFSNIKFAKHYFIKSSEPVLNKSLQNAAGFMYSNFYGFGELNVRKLIFNLKNLVLKEPQRTFCSSVSENGVFKFDNCNVKWVDLVFVINTPHDVYITSPEQTTRFASKRGNISASAAFYGESGKGEWKITVCGLNNKINMTIIGFDDIIENLGRVIKVPGKKVILTCKFTLLKNATKTSEDIIIELVLCIVGFFALLILGVNQRIVFFNLLKKIKTRK